MGWTVKEDLLVQTSSENLRYVIFLEVIRSSRPLLIVWIVDGLPMAADKEEEADDDNWIGNKSDKLWKGN